MWFDIFDDGVVWGCNCVFDYCGGECCDDCGVCGCDLGLILEYLVDDVGYWGEGV